MKRLLNFIVGKLFKIPRVNLDTCYPPVKCETTSLDIENVGAVVTIPIGLSIPEEALKKEVAHKLSDKLINYITFETFEDPKRDQVCYMGTISIVKER